ncbi:hypothetical protein CALCODRAFT_444209 [Calocera cornea HHB12733]|uniref:CxC6 like cysteine cluster associated with KDZ domain-containing protein n=1 Tax=Calocera cornea HHB12733 TaxID=1353952 RepID=A0A165CF94_9BASI|nr:hypothetical protein CALCODRAFT_444209 [Calocera cornea HHB12733]
MLSCAITDGVSIGRPCCRVHNCANPLPTNRSRYCLQHQAIDAICAVEGCEEPAPTGRRTCNTPEHRQLEDHYNATGKSFKILKKRLQQAYNRGNNNVPLYGNDEEADQEEEDEDDDLEEEEAELSAQAHVQAQAEGQASAEGEPQNSQKLNPPSKPKARFGRRRTHNEQLIVRPCGIIVGRATFYGAESLSAVVKFIRSVFPTEKSLPDVIFYDNNCQLHRYVHDRPDLREYFKHTALVVDVFHFKTKHSEKDEYCSQHCNAMAYPELYDEPGKRWTFNSSACEQTNAWLRKFQGIVREMLPVRYEFFLDEVIKARNSFLVQELQKAKRAPDLVPIAALKTHQ